MKRMVGISAGVLAFGLLACLGNALFVQAQPGTSGGTRVATVNMYTVMKKYKKVEVFKAEMQTLAKPFEEDMKKLDNAYTKWVEFAKHPGIKPEDKDKAQKTLVELKRQMEDKKTEAQKVIVARGQEQIVQVFREIEAGIQKYAASNGIHIVLHYLEPEEGKYTAPNIDRKLNGCGNVGACCPIFMAPGVDISEDVVKVLNSAVTASN